MRITKNTSDFGGMAVNWFFVISGFLITGSFKNSSSLKDYLVKRVLRIVPGFTIAFLLSLFLFGALGSIKGVNVYENIKHYFSAVGLKNNVARLLTLQSPKAGAGFEGVPLPRKLNSPLWTIQFEFICYLFVPVMALMKIHKIKWITLLLFILAYSIMLFQKFGNFFPWDANYKSLFLGDPYYLPRFLTYFLSGACFYIFKDNVPRHTGLTLLSLILIVVASLQGSMVDIVMPVAGSYLLFYIAFHPGFIFSKFASKGDFSYGTYLYAWPVQQLIMYYFADKIQPLSLFIFASVFTLAIAFLSWHLIEKSFLQLKNKYSLPEVGRKAW